MVDSDPTPPPNKILYQTTFFYAQHVLTRFFKIPWQPQLTPLPALGFSSCCETIGPIVYHHPQTETSDIPTTLSSRPFYWRLKWPFTQCQSFHKVSTAANCVIREHIFLGRGGTVQRSGLLRLRAGTCPDAMFVLVSLWFGASWDEVRWLEQCLNKGVV